MFSLSDNVKQQFTERLARLSDAELHNHQKVVTFKESIKNSFMQGEARGETRLRLRRKCIHDLQKVFNNSYRRTS